MEELIGSKLHDRYQIESLLSRQSGRRTFLATDLHTQTSVAIKLLLFGPDFTWEDLKLFEREAEVLKSLACPSIPQYLDFFEVELERGKGFALVQTYIKAKSLQQWVKEGRTFSDIELKSIAIDLLKILDYLHNRNPAVIHRDIKPSNILLTDRTAHNTGEIYLIDFGSVQTAIHGGGTRTIVGTYGYMPPEQFGGIATPSTDIYALGATLIYLATGSHPDELPQQEFKIQFEERVNLPPRLLRWIQQAIVPNPNRRFPSAQQALLSLDGNISLSNAPSDPIVKKPAGSKVQIKRSHDRIEILQPSPNFYNDVTITFVVVAVVSHFIMSAIVNIQSITGINAAIRPQYILLLALVTLTLWAIPILLAIKAGQSVKMMINRSTTSLENMFFGYYRMFENIGATVNINKIELLPYIGNIYYNPKGSSVIRKHLVIWIGTQSISFGNTLTLPELEWIGECLSEWLDVPFSKT